MQIGKMRERVEIQTATVTKGTDYNEEVLTWATTQTVWAQVKEKGGREPLLADRPVMLVSYEVTIRTPATAPTHKNRLVWRTKYLTIDTVTPIPQDGLTVMRCLESVG